MGISEIAFKVTPADSAGVLVLENTFRAPGGPARHLHHDQDEWFYVVEGEFAMEIGASGFTLRGRRFGCRAEGDASRLGVHGQARAAQSDGS